MTFTLDIVAPLALGGLAGLLAYLGGMRLEEWWHRRKLNSTRAVAAKSDDGQRAVPTADHHATRLTYVWRRRELNLRRLSAYLSSIKLEKWSQRRRRKPTQAETASLGSKQRAEPNAAQNDDHHKKRLADVRRQREAGLRLLTLLDTQQEAIRGQLNSNALETPPVPEPPTSPPSDLYDNI